MFKFLCVFAYLRKIKKFLSSTTKKEAAKGCFTQNLSNPPPLPPHLPPTDFLPFFNPLPSTLNAYLAYLYTCKLFAVIIVPLRN